MFAGLRKPRELIVIVVTLLAYGQYISLKDLPREAPKREDQAGRQNRETAPPDQRAQVEAAGASWVCTCCRPA